MKRERGKLYCFSPLVMAITFIVEISLAVYTLWRYRLNEITKIVVSMLAFLALFQAAEYMVCEGTMGGGLLWSRIGYVAITLLPPLGIHLVYTLAGAKKRPLMMPAYATAAGFSTFFIGMGGAFSGHECVGNYVIFQVAPGLGGMFATYYYVWLGVALYLAYKFMHQTTSEYTRRALMGLSAGYAAFIVPTATANIMSPDTVRGIPSIMCGFAVILAVLLITTVLPGVAEERVKND